MRTLFPIGRRRNQTPPYGITLDVAGDCQQMGIILDNETLEPPLPDMAAGPVMLVIAAHMACHKPLHPAA